MCVFVLLKCMPKHFASDHHMLIWLVNMRIFMNGDVCSLVDYTTNTFIAAPNLVLTFTFL